MLLSYETLIYYGPGAIAILDNSAGSFACDIKGSGRQQATITAQGIISSAHVTGLKNSPMTASGLGVITTALPKGVARPALTVSIGSRPSAYDIAQAVLNASEEEYNIPGTLAGNVYQAANPQPIDSAAIADAVLSALAGDLSKLDAIKTRTDRIPQYPAADDDIPTADENAEAVWRYTRD